MKPGQAQTTGMALPESGRVRATGRALRANPPCSGRPPTSPRQRGFTLLEVLVAVAILGVTVVSLLGLHARNLQLASDARDITVGTSLAMQVVSRTRIGVVPENGRTEGVFTTDPEAKLDEGECFGPRGTEGFLWVREVGPTELPTLRDVRVSVFRPDDPTPLAELGLVMRGGGL